MGPMALNGPAQLNLSTGMKCPAHIIETTQRIEQGYAGLSGCDTRRFPEWLGMLLKGG